MQRRRADFTFRRVHDTQKGAVVIRVGEYTQIGQQIFDFRAREEGGSAGNFVRDAVLHQHLFKDARLVVAAIQDRVIFIFRFIDEVVRNQLARHALRFMLFIIGTEHFELRAIAKFREKAFFEDVRVIGNQDICRFQDAPGGAVVLFQLDHLQRRKIFAQQHQVLWTRTAPGVD